MSFDPSPVYVVVSDIAPVVATVTPSAASVSFEIADTSIATVGAAGFNLTVTGLKTGTTELRAYCGGVVCGKTDVRALDLKLKEVTYDGDKLVTITSDDQSATLSAPHWQDNSDPPNGTADDPKDRKHPVAFPRDAALKVSAKISIGAEPPAGAKIKVKADAAKGPGLAPVVPDVKGTLVTVPVTVATTPWDKAISIYEPHQLTWRFLLMTGRKGVGAMLG